MKSKEKNRYYKTNLLLSFVFVIVNMATAQVQLEIWEIQGTENRSDYQGDRIQTKDNIVTATGDNFFYMQTPPERADQNDLTSNGIYVSSGGAAVQVGDRVDIIGTIKEFDDNTYISSDNIIIDVLSSSNTLPDPVLLDDNFPTGLAADVLELEQLEGMLVEIKNGWITAPSDDSGNSYISAANERPFREPGIAYPSNFEQLVWDNNPEVMEFETAALGLSENRYLSAGMRIDAIGIINDSNDKYAFRPINYETSGEPPLRTARTADAQEATIGNINVLLFFNDESNYDIRLRKVANYVVNSMGSPDIIAFQELGGLAELKDIAAEVLKLDETAIYTTYISNGSGSIDTGFLVKNTVTVTDILELGKSESLSIGGRMHDRPPFLLEGMFNTNPPTPINVMNVHLRSLNGIEGFDSFFVRTKRHEAAISVANMVRNMQNMGKDLILVGDFNAFEFSDGYVDVMSQITGQPSLGADFETEPVLTTPLTNHVLSVPAEDRYSFVFQGNAQVLDHCLSTELQDKTFNELQFIRGNADNPDIYLDDTVPYRVSDHDGFVVYLGLNSEMQAAAVEPNPFADAPTISYPNPFDTNDQVRFNFPQKSNVDYQVIDLNGRVLSTGTFTAIDQSLESLDLPPQIITGLYILKITSSNLEWTDKFFIIN